MITFNYDLQKNGGIQIINPYNIRYNYISIFYKIRTSTVAKKDNPVKIGRA